MIVSVICSLTRVAYVLIPGQLLRYFPIQAMGYIAGKNVLFSCNCRLIILIFWCVDIWLNCTRTWPKYSGWHIFFSVFMKLQNYQRNMWSRTDKNIGTLWDTTQKAIPLESRLWEKNVLNKTRSFIVTASLNCSQPANENQILKAQWAGVRPLHPLLYY